MPARKLTDDQIEEFSFYICQKLSRADICDYFDFSTSTFRSYVQKAIKMNYLTRVERKKWLTQRSKESGFASFKEKYGEKRARRICHDAWSDGLGSLPEKNFRKFSQMGGDKTQELHPEVAENLKNAEQYKQRICNYGNLKFQSAGERFVAFLLVESGLLDNLVVGENFQKDFGNLNVDFYIIKKDIVIEYHPVPKNHRGIRASTLEAYAQERENQLRRNGFNGRLIVIESVPDIYSALKSAGLTKLSRKTYYQRYWRVVNLLKNYDEHGKVHPKFKSLEETVSQGDDLVPETEDEKDVPF